MLYHVPLEMEDPAQSLSMDSILEMLKVDDDYIPKSRRLFCWMSAVSLLSEPLMTINQGVSQHRNKQAVTNAINLIEERCARVATTMAGMGMGKKLEERLTELTKAKRDGESKVLLLTVILPLMTSLPPLVGDKYLVDLVNDMCSIIRHAYLAEVVILVDSLRVAVGEEDERSVLQQFLEEHAPHVSEKLGHLKQDAGKMMTLISQVRWEGNPTKTSVMMYPPMIHGNPNQKPEQITEVTLGKARKEKWTEVFGKVPIDKARSLLH